MNRYQNACTEVYVILNCLEEEEYEKLPKEMTNAIEDNRNLDYDYELNEELDLRNQSMLPETKAILFNLFRDYLSMPEQKEKIIRMQKEERRRNEIKKQQQYDSSNLFNNRGKVIMQNREEKEYLEQTAIAKVKEENIFLKILNKIRRFFANIGKDRNEKY